MKGFRYIIATNYFTLKHMQHYKTCHCDYPIALILKPTYNDYTFQAKEPTTTGPSSMITLIELHEYSQIIPHYSQNNSKIPSGIKIPKIIFT